MGNLTNIGIKMQDSATTTTTTTTPPNYTVRLYGARATGGTATLWYGINDVTCPSGGASLSTGGALLYTLTIASGTTLWIQTRNASDVTVINCTQDTTGTYCSTYGTCTFSHYITAAIDISTKANAATTC